MSFSGGASGPIASAFVEVTADTDAAIREIHNISRAFEGIEDSAEESARAIERAFKNASESANRSLRNIDDGNAFNDLESKSARTGDAIGENVEGGSGRAAAAFGILKVGALALGTALGAGGAAMVTFGLQSAASLEQTRISFKALLGSAEEADAFIRQMQDFAAKTPFEFAGLADNARALLATSSALKITRGEIIPTIGTIGDLVSVLGAPPDAIDRVVNAFAQMASKGKASTEEIQQLAEALPGFPIFDAMAKGLGITTAALQDQLSKGLIPADVGVQALLKGMREFPGAAGAMAQQAETLNGLFSTFKDTISLTLTDAFQPLVGEVKKALAPLTEVVGDVLKTIAPQVSGIATTLLKAFTPFLKEIGPGVTDVFAGIGNVLEGLAPVVGAVGKAFGTALSAIGTAIAPLGDAIAPVIKLLAELLTKILPPLAVVITTVVVALTPFIDAIAKVGTRLISVLAPAIIKITDAFANTLGPALLEVAQIIGTALITVLERLGPHLDEIIMLLADHFIVVMEELAPILPEIALAFANLAVALTELVIAILPVLPPLIRVATILFENINAPILLAIAWAFTTMANAISGLIGFVAGLVEPLTNVSARFADIKNVLQPIADFFTTTLGPVWTGFKDNVLQPFLDMVEFRVIPKLNELKDVTLLGLSNFITTTLKPAWDDFKINTLEPFLATVETRASIALFNLRIAFELLKIEIRDQLKPAFDDMKLNAIDPLIKTWNEEFVPATDDLRRALYDLWVVVSPILTPALEIMGGIAKGLAMFAFPPLTLAILAVRTASDNLAGGISFVLQPAVFALEAVLFSLKLTMHAAGLVADGVRGALDFLSSAMRGIAGAADVARGAIDFVKGAIHALENPLSTILNLVGRVGDAFRGLSNIRLPSLPSFPSIPGFASGGIINRDQLAMLHAPEVVIPMDNPKRAMALLSESGLLDMIAGQSNAARGPAAAIAGSIASNARAAAAGAISIGRISVNVSGNVSEEQGRTTGEAIVNGIEETIRRRQLALTVRTL